jgi:hypothetical protein
VRTSTRGNGCSIQQSIDLGRDGSNQSQFGTVRLGEGLRKLGQTEYRWKLETSAGKRVVNITGLKEGSWSVPSEWYYTGIAATAGPMRIGKEECEGRMVVTGSVKACRIASVVGARVDMMLLVIVGYQ